MPNNTSGITTFPLTAFGGLDYRDSAGPGAIASLTNFVSDAAPRLRVRDRYEILHRFDGGFGGMTSVDGKLYYVAGGVLHDENPESEQDEAWRILPGSYTGERRFAALGRRLAVFPEKVLFTIGDDGFLTGSESLTASVTGSGVTIGAGTYAGEEAEACALTFPAGTDLSAFAVGEAVRVSGCVTVPANNGDRVIRGIDGTTLLFYENSFQLPDGETSYTESSVTAERPVPDLDFLCVNDNRVWGCKDDTIWACAPGNPKNWYNFEGLAGDAWSVDSGTPGAFTGCVSYLGYPTFFKRDRIFKVYGGIPRNFELHTTADAPGVETGCGDTLATAGGTLFYVSPFGVMAYTGGQPRLISENLGSPEQPVTAWAAGGDGFLYVVRLWTAKDTQAWLYVFDSLRAVWTREDGAIGGEDLVSFASVEDGLAMGGSDVIYRVRTRPDAPPALSGEDVVPWQVTFAPWYAEGFDALFPARVRLRVRAEEDTVCLVWVRFDNGDWIRTAILEGCDEEEAAAYLAVGGGGALGGTGLEEDEEGEPRRGILAPGENVLYLPFRDRVRCGAFSLRLTGSGPFTLIALAVEVYDSGYPRR